MKTEKEYHKVLKALYLLGGSSDTTKIAELCGKKYMNTYRALTRLNEWSKVIKVHEGTNCFWRIRDTQNAVYLLREVYGDELED